MADLSNFETPIGKDYSAISRLADAAATEQFLRAVPTNIARGDVYDLFVNDYDDPEDGGFMDAESGGGGARRVADFRAEAEEIFSRKQNNPNKNEAEVISNALENNMTAEEVLCKTSVIWEQRFKSAQEYERKVSNIPYGSADYEERYIRFRTARLTECWAAINDPKNDPRLPNAVRHSRKWFNELKRQFMLMPTRYENLTYFGNVMVQMATDMDAIANPGQNSEIMLLIRIACLAAPRFNTKQSLMVLLAGDASVGKSYLMHKNMEMLPPGWAILMSHMSALALSDDQNDDFVVLMVEETPMTMTQETSEKTGQDGGASFIKSLFTNKICITRTVAYDKGMRKRQVHVTSKMMTGVFATNGALVSSSPLLKRYLVLKPNFDPNIASKINTVESTGLGEEKKNAATREKIISHLVQLTELMIGMGAIKQVNMDSFALIWNNVVKEMALAGHRMTDAKAVTQVREVVHTLVVVKAVCEAVLSEVNVGLRVNAETGEFKRFEDHFVEHFANIEARLVAQEPEIYFGISLCASIFGDELEGRIVEAARRVVGLERKNGEWFLTKTPHLLPHGVDLVDMSRSILYKSHYVELMPAEGRGEENVVSALISKLSEKPSRTNTLAAFKELSKKTLLHEEVVLSKEDNGKYKVVLRATTTKQTKSPVVYKVTLDENHEQQLLDPFNERGSTSRCTNAKQPRYYFLLPALVKFRSQNEAMKMAISKMQHQGSTRQRHLIASPFSGPRSRILPVERLFYGIFDYIDFAPKPDVLLFFNSFHTLLGEQMESLNPANMFDGGDPGTRDLSKEEFDRRQVEKFNRSIAVQTPVAVVQGMLDYYTYINRQQECAAHLEGADMLHWSNFTKVCIAMRRDMSKNFGTMTLENYPEKIVAAAMHRNTLVDIEANDKLTTAEKKEIYPSFDSISTSRATTIASPSKYLMIEAFRERGIDGLRNLFVTNRSSLIKPPQLDDASSALIANDVEARKSWKTAQSIFTSYTDAEKTMQFFLTLAGFRAVLLPTTSRALQSRIVSLERRAAPESSALPRPSVSERMKTKRVDDEFEPSKRPRSALALFDEASAPPPASSGEASTVDQYNRTVALMGNQPEHFAMKTALFFTPESAATLDEILSKSFESDAAQVAEDQFDEDRNVRDHYEDAPNPLSEPISLRVGR